MGAARLPFFNPSTPYKKIVSKGIKREEEKKLRTKAAPAVGVPGTRHPFLSAGTRQTATAFTQKILCVKALIIWPIIRQFAPLIKRRWKT